MPTPTAPGAATVASLRLLAKRALRFGLLAGFCCSLLQLAVPLYMMQVYDRVLGSGNLDTLLVLTLLVAGALAVHALLDVVQAEAFAAVGHRAARAATVPALRAAVLAAARGGQAKPSQALRDVAEIRAFAGSPHVPAPLEAALSPMLLLVLFLLHPAYGLVALAGALVLAGLGWLASRRTVPPTREANRQLVQGTAALEVAARSAEAIGPMGIMRHLAARWDAWSRDHLAQVEEAGRAARHVAALARALRLALQAAVLCTGAVLVLDHAASPGSMFAASLITFRAVAPFDRLVEAWRAWASAREAWERVEALVTHEGPGRERGMLPAPSGPLALERLTYVPAGLDRPTVRNVSFTVAPGEAVAVVGPSGAGKTTLARLAVGSLEPTQGAAFLDGHNLWHWGPSLGDHVGYLPQSVGLMEGTVAENIARMGPVRWDDILEAARRAGAHDMVGRLPRGYDTPVGEAGALLSGGQRQLIALARALYREPRLLILDEPNANLDHSGDQAVARAIQHAKGWGAAVLLVTHRPGLLASADRVVLLREGMVDQVGTRAEMAARLMPARDGQQRPAEAGQSTPRLAPTS